ncbi:MAG: hypothetical protein Q8N51_05730 [Gammaproteobacteria bacterium]|nr:hypothetical protein [Gammaproteobacteria bacterium]
MTPDNHELFTRMLFIDGILGAGLHDYEVAQEAVDSGLATFTGNQHNESWMWRRIALEKLSLPALQDLYTSLKLREVTHAG